MGSRVIAIGALLAVSGEASAQTSAGARSLGLARSAWEHQSLELAESLYKEALEKGGLAPSEVLEGYVRLGSIRASAGKKDSALAAFRAASVLDAGFSVPTEAGSKGVTLAERAKKDTAKIGSIQIAIDAPKEVPAGKAFKISMTIDKAHMPIINKIGMVAKDGTTGKEVTLDAKPQESVEFELDASLALPSASIVVRVDALDSRLNRLASAEERVKVGDRPAASGPITSAGGAKETGAAPATIGGSVAGGDAGPQKSGGFWSTPWPYVIGGIALVGAGTAVYFGVRPTDSVSVSEPGVRTR